MRIFGVLVAAAWLFATGTPAAQAPGSARAVLDVPDEAFEVASVKPNQSGREQWDFDTPPGRVIGTNILLRDLIRFGYYIYGGDFDLRIDAPNWIKTARFDLEGTTKGAVSQARAMALLRHLLAERFALKVHYEAREQPAYALAWPQARGDDRSDRGSRRRSHRATDGELDCRRTILIFPSPRARAAALPRARASSRHLPAGTPDSCRPARRSRRRRPPDG